MVSTSVHCALRQARHSFEDLATPSGLIKLQGLRGPASVGLGIRALDQVLAELDGSSSVRNSVARLRLAAATLVAKREELKAARHKGALEALPKLSDASIAFGKALAEAENAAGAAYKPLPNRSRIETLQSLLAMTPAPAALLGAEFMGEIREMVRILGKISLDDGSLVVNSLVGDAGVEIPVLRRCARRTSVYAAQEGLEHALTRYGSCPDERTAHYQHLIKIFQTLSNFPGAAEILQYGKVRTSLLELSILAIWEGLERIPAMAAPRS